MFLAMEFAQTIWLDCTLNPKTLTIVVKDFVILANRTGVVQVHRYTVNGYHSGIPKHAIALSFL